MAKIGIDIRLWGIKHAGIGRYTEELVRNLQEADKGNEYILFCRRSDIGGIPSREGWRKVIADIPHYTLREQIFLPGIFKKEKLDLLHVPHFNVPVLYRGKFIATIHDILWHEFRGVDVTTLPVPLYLIKHLGYRFVVSNTLHRAAKIITPTNTVKNNLVERFGILPEKVAVTREGAPVDFDISIYRKKEVLEKHRIRKPYLLYVGSLYPHKNVESVVRALKLVKKRDINLVIVSSRNVFTERFMGFIRKERAEELVKFLGYVPDEELAVLYKNAEAFIYPTLSEGFGLPGLEAMASGTPVACSDIPVLREVYADAALYFNPRDTNDITDKIKLILADKKLRADLVSKSNIQVKKYSWRKMAEETLQIYNSVLNPI